MWVLLAAVVLLVVRDLNGWASVRRYARNNNRNVLALHRRIDALEKAKKDS